MLSATPAAGDKMVLKAKSEEDDNVLLLKKYKASKKHLEGKLWKEDGILKAMTASVRQQVKKMSSSDNEERLLEETAEELMKRYGEQKTRKKVWESW